LPIWDADQADDARGPQRRADIEHAQQLWMPTAAAAA
jgi:hypothetical protein